MPQRRAACLRGLSRVCPGTAVPGMAAPRKVSGNVSGLKSCSVRERDFSDSTLRGML
jgi:hypothetical protein